MRYTPSHEFELVTGGNASVGSVRLIHGFCVALVHGLSEGLPHTTV